VVGSLNGLDFTTDVELLGGVVEVSDGRVGIVVGTHDVDSLEVLVGRVDVGDCNYKLGATIRRKLNQDLPVRMARAASSRGSRRATFAPALRPRAST